MKKVFLCLGLLLVTLAYSAEAQVVVPSDEGGCTNRPQYNWGDCEVESENGHNTYKCKQSTFNKNCDGTL